MSSPISVTVVMPSLNVAAYIRPCIESVLQQTLRDLEIICVDAGSTDGTLEILEEYARKDSRITILHSDRKSYGYQMNLGFDAARGEYLGIVETDDYAESDMFERLLDAARRDRLDVAKAGYFLYYSREQRNEPCPIGSKAMCSRVFCPVTDFRSPVEQAEFFNLKPTIWSAIYRREFIREQGIRFNETPGASYQDLSFTFQVLALAGRVRLLPECYLHYRQDNEQSSVNSPGKVYCVCDEYDAIQAFLDSHPTLKGRLEPVMARMRYDSYMWNYGRLADEYKPAFVRRMSEDFAADMTAGKCVRRLYPLYKWRTMALVIQAPEEFERWKAAEKAGQPYTPRLPDESLPQKLRVRLAGGIACVRDHGVAYTARYAAEKIRRRIQS